MRRYSHPTQKTDNYGWIVDAVSISERPVSEEDRMVPGHWEGDWLFGSGNSQIATLVEHQTHYVMLVKVAGKEKADHKTLHSSYQYQGAFLRPPESLAT